MPEPNEKTYLGDGAYAEFDGFGIKLTAENGISATDTIYLEPEVLGKLIKFAFPEYEKTLKDAIRYCNEMQDNDERNSAARANMDFSAKNTSKELKKLLL